jgi:ankyrin repeat protein
MPTFNSASENTRALPEQPNLRHLQDQAKDLFKEGGAKSLTDAQFRIATLYGFASWVKLKTHVESLESVGQLKQAIDSDDLTWVIALMTAHPDLRRAPLGYGKNGPLTWVAECRTQVGAPSADRLAMAQWMIENGSDIHQGGDGPLMRAALKRTRIPMMELLVAHGADVNAQWSGDFPILFAPCETIDPVVLAWLLAHGADPNVRSVRQDGNTTALDYLIGTYVRSPELGECVRLLQAAGGTTRYDLSGVLAILTGDTEGLADVLRADPTLVHRRYPELDFGSTGGRRLLLSGGTLLHVAAEYGNTTAAQLVLNHGALVDAPGGAGETPLFHAVTQFHDHGLAMTQLLLEHGADVNASALVPGHYERADEFVTCTPLGYARLFPDDEFPGSNSKTIALLERLESK